MSRFGFTSSGTYTSESPNVAADRCVNWYPEKVEVGGTTPVALYPTPGISPVWSFSGVGKVQCLYSYNDRAFGIADNFGEIFPNASITNYSFLPTSTGPATMAANNSGQLLMASAGQAWLFPLIAPSVISSAVSTDNTRAIATIASVVVGALPLCQITLTLGSVSPAAWSNGQYLTLTGLTAFPTLNGALLQVESGAGTATIVCVPDNFNISTGAVAETGNIYQYQATVSFTCTTVPLVGAGQKFSVNGLTNMPGYNGQIFTATAVVGATITGLPPASIHYNYSGAETGTLASAGMVTAPTQVLIGQGPVSQIGYLDDYFIALMDNSQKFRISALGDGTQWNPIDTFQVSEFADNLIAMFISHRELWLFGAKQTLVYGNSGDPLIPFQPIPGAFIEQGIAAKWSVQKLDNSIFWIGADERGNGIAWKANGYTPLRVSNHAVENAWRTYSDISDARAYTYQENGHAFWVIWFPTADKTWVYDAATGQWHERMWFNNGAEHAHRGCCHTFVFGKHMVGDRIIGLVYDQSISYLQDNVGGRFDDIIRIRRAPHVGAEKEWMYHQQLQVDLETGIWPSGIANAQTAINLTDVTGAKWTLAVADSGALVYSGIGTLPEDVVILEDQGVPLTYYQLAADTSGVTVLLQVLNPPSSLPYVVLESPGGFFYQIRCFAGILQDPAILIPDFDPQITLRWSPDGGKTWSNSYSISAGAAGEYTKRCIWRRLGRARDRVYEIRVSDPVAWRIVDSYLKIYGV